MPRWVVITLAGLCPAAASGAVTAIVVVVTMRANLDALSAEVAELKAENRATVAEIRQDVKATQDLVVDLIRETAMAREGR